MTLRALFVIALTLVSSTSGASNDLIISDAWVRATPPGKMMTAGPRSSFCRAVSPAPTHPR